MRKPTRLTLYDSEIEWLTKRIGELGSLDNPACEYCGKSECKIQDNLVDQTGMLIDDDGSYASPLVGPIYPCAVMICQTCGHTKLFNTEVIGFKAENVRDGDDLNES